MGALLERLNQFLARAQGTETVVLSAENVSKLSWRQVQHLLGEAYRRRGYGVRPVTSDVPADFVLDKDGEKTVVNCKHWQVWEVGEHPLRELYGYTTGLGAKGAVMVTTGRFSQRAIGFADSHNLRLIDGRGIRELVTGN
jgi:restriction system protein